MIADVINCRISSFPFTETETSLAVTISATLLVTVDPLILTLTSFTPVEDGGYNVIMYHS
ncbi:MAG: hypothetical protein AAB116_09770 [Candidatus Poribacteria bacterium]